MKLASCGPSVACAAEGTPHFNALGLPDVRTSSLQLINVEEKNAPSPYTVFAIPLQKPTYAVSDKTHCRVPTDSPLKSKDRET